MSAMILTPEVAAASNINIVKNGRYTQAVHETIVAYRANRRSGTASVKTKATVNLSGSKPWKQKGTGRARAGYKSSPVWVGGGVVFGPHPRDYSKKVSKKIKRIALLKVLSVKILSEDIFLTDSFSFKTPKTKEFVNFIYKFTKDSKILLISQKFDENIKLAARNVSTAQLITSAEVNAEHFLYYKKIILTNDGLTELAQRINK